MFETFFRLKYIEAERLVNKMSVKNQDVAFASEFVSEFASLTRIAKITDFRDPKNAGHFYEVTATEGKILIYIKTKFQNFLLFNNIFPQNRKLYILLIKIFKKHILKIFYI